MKVYVKVKCRDWDGIQSIVGVFDTLIAAGKSPTVLRHGEYTRIDEFELKKEEN